MDGRTRPDVASIVSTEPLLERDGGGAVLGADMGSVLGADMGSGPDRSPQRRRETA